MSTATQIIELFELQVDDTSELSSTEELSILNRIYKHICSLKAWEFLKKAGTGTTSTTVPYIALPSDFSYLTQNNNYTETSGNEAQGPVVFVGSNYSPYKVVSWSDRRQYRDQDGVCYIDIVNNRLYFAKQPTSAENVEFDYVSAPVSLGASDTPAIPDRFQPILIYAMAVDDAIIQQSDKAKSYRAENQAKYKEFLDSLSYWNSRLVIQ